MLTQKNSAKRTTKSVVSKILVTGSWLVSTQLKKYDRQIGSFPQVSEVFVVQSTYPKTLEPSKVANFRT